MASTYESLKAKLNSDRVIILSPPGASVYRPPAGASLIPLTQSEKMTCSSHYVHLSERHIHYSIRNDFFSGNIRGLFAPKIDWFHGYEPKEKFKACKESMINGGALAIIAQLSDTQHGGKYRADKITKDDYHELLHFSIKEGLKLTLVVPTTDDKIPKFLEDPHRKKFDAFHGAGIIRAAHASKIIAEHHGKKRGIRSVPSWIFKTRQPICSELLIEDIAHACPGRWPISAEEWIETRAQNLKPDSPFNRFLKSKVKPLRLSLNSYLFWRWMVKTFFTDRKEKLFWTDEHSKIDALGITWMSRVLD